MSNRRKVNIRERFSESEKKAILAKSKGRCARCGKELDISSMTIEHVIPLSKGGENRVSNLVALCEDCNKSKGNAVVLPVYYYKYLGEDYLRQLMDLSSELIESDGWLNYNTFLPYDEYPFPNFIHPLAKKNFDVSKGFRNYFDKSFYIACGCGFLLLKRARFKNLKDILKFYDKLIKKGRYKGILEDVEEKVKSNLKNGAVFMLKYGGVIKGVYLFSIGIVEIDGINSFGMFLDSTYSYTDFVDIGLMDELIFTYFNYNLSNEVSSKNIDNAITVRIYNIKDMRNKALCLNPAKIEFDCKNDVYYIGYGSIPEGEDFSSVFGEGSIYYETFLGMFNGLTIDAILDNFDRVFDGIVDGKSIRVYTRKYQEEV